MIKERHERALILVLSFVVPGLVMLWVYASLGIAPFGDRTVLVSDMSSQYVNFFCSLKNGDLFFSWSKALGTGYIGVISYYVSSPLSLLTLFVPNETMPVGLALLTVLKIALAGLSFCAFAQRRFPGCGMSALICAVCYALMSYNAAYSLCIMWLDGVIWLPLILLALERILEGRSAGPFIAALTVCFISTWYISYMIGIFCVLYLCVRLVALKPQKAALSKLLRRFFGGAACALGLTAWLWLPTLMAMFIGKFNGVNFSSVYSELVICNPILLLSQFLPGRYSGGLAYNALPYVFCGTAVLVLVLVHFSFWEPYKREKLAERGMLLILALSMMLAPLDKVWHLFQHPNWFMFRYAFLLSFFLLYLSVQALSNMLAALEIRGRGIRRGAALVFVALAVVDMGFNMKGIAASLQEEYGSDSYQAYQAYYTACAQLVSAALADSGGRFFRMGSMEERGLNSPLSFGYPGITHYSSFYNYNVNSTLKSLGFAQSWYWCVYSGSTPATDALLDMEYVMSRNELPGYELLGEAQGLKLWKTPDVLPLAFLSQSGQPEIVGAGPFERQNSLISGLLGEETVVFRRVSDAEERRGPGETSFTFTGAGEPIYADLSAGEVGEVLVNGETVLSLGRSEQMSIHYLCTPEAGERCTITVRHGGGWTGTLWELDWEELCAAIEELDGTEVTEVGKSGLVRLTAQADGTETLVTTIPAESGWSAYVDGQRAETDVWLNAFLALDLPAGAHEIELRYTAPGLVPGVGLGCVSVLALVGLEVLKHRKKA